MDLFKRHCVVKGCAGGAHAFRIPVKLREKWCANLNLDVKTCPKAARVCSTHFNSECLPKNKLKKGSIPTLNLSHNDEPKYKPCFPPKLKGYKLCCIAGCNVTSRMEKLYYFPKNAEKLSRWVASCNFREKTEHVRCRAICKKHFHPNDIMDNKKLKKNALPIMDKDFSKGIENVSCNKASEEVELLETNASSENLPFEEVQLFDSDDDSEEVELFKEGPHKEDVFEKTACTENGQYDEYSKEMELFEKDCDVVELSDGCSEEVELFNKGCEKTAYTKNASFKKGTKQLPPIGKTVAGDNVLYKSVLAWPTKAATVIKGNETFCPRCELNAENCNFYRKKYEDLERKYKEVIVEFKKLQKQMQQLEEPDSPEQQTHETKKMKSN